MNKADRTLLEYDTYPDAFPWDDFRSYEKLGLGGLFYKVWKDGYTKGKEYARSDELCRSEYHEHLRLCLMREMETLRNLWNAYIPGEEEDKMMEDQLTIVEQCLQAVVRGKRT